ncbi:MAG TPA: hypothetical protein VKE72_05555, partial [Methylocella sp.]|nr:hypothetical protein [Methylocella sp.]
MRASEDFGEIDERAPRAPLRCSPAITGAGLTLGRGTILARLTKDALPRLAIDGDEERILAMLSAALGKGVPVRVNRKYSACFGAMGAGRQMPGA